MLRFLILEPSGYPLEAETRLRQFGEVLHFRGDVALADALAESDVLIVRLRHKIDRGFLSRAPRLKFISTATTGLDHIDARAAQERGIVVLSLRGELDFLRTVSATAEHTWGLLLGLIRRIPWAHTAVVGGSWDRSSFFGRELQQRTLGIVGLGRVGRMVAHYGQAFRMAVRAYDPHSAEWSSNVGRSPTLDELLSISDVVSLHVPLNEQTRGMIGRRELTKVKPGAVLVNTSRGAILDEPALLESLQSGRLAGAALDVIQDEYNVDKLADTSLLRYAATHTNLLITPHLGGATHDSLAKAELFMAQKLESHLKGTSVSTRGSPPG